MELNKFRKKFEADTCEILKIEKFVSDLMHAEPIFEIGIKELEEEYSCKINCVVEKENQLQFTYFYTIDFGFEECLHLEIESGISNGTMLNFEEWNTSTSVDFPSTKEREVLKDIILDESYYEKGSFAEKKAQAYLESRKSYFFEIHRKMSYDNYFGGGGYRMELNGTDRQLFLEYVYEIIEVDRSIYKIL